MTNMIAKALVAAAVVGLTLFPFYRAHAQPWGFNLFGISVGQNWGWGPQVGVGHGVIPARGVALGVIPIMVLGGILRDGPIGGSRIALS